jgi:DNA-binding CsgD family transcriptional regulator
MTLTARERRPGPLTPRQAQVGRLILDGLTYVEIGQALHLAPKTVETYVVMMRHRLGLGGDGEDRRRSRLFAALRAYFADERDFYVRQDAT